MKIRTALLTVPTVVLALVAGLAAPASAGDPYDVRMTSGRIVFGGVTAHSMKVPSPVGCPSSVSLDGTIDPTDPTDNMTGDLDATIPWHIAIVPPGSDYIFTASGGSGTGANAGVFDPSTVTFAGLQIPSVAFTIRNKSLTGCTPTTTVACSGTMSLTLTGGLYDGSTLPLTNPESFYVNATGTVLFRSSPCVFPLSALITVGTAVALGDNPDDDIAPTGFTDPGAIFVQA